MTSPSQEFGLCLPFKIRQLATGINTIILNERVVFTFQNKAISNKKLARYAIIIVVFTFQNKAISNKLKKY